MVKFHHNVLLQPCLLAQNWLTCILPRPLVQNWLTYDLDHFLCQIESRTIRWNFMRIQCYGLAFWLRCGSHVAHMWFEPHCAKLKVNSNCQISSQYNATGFPFGSEFANMWFGPLFVPNWKSIKINKFHQNVMLQACL